MPKYKCIACGAEQESEDRCICGSCGYTMYEAPFDKYELLKSEIRRFIMCYINETINADDLYFPKLEDDEKRFPSFLKIRNYIYDAVRSEDFIERIKTSCEQLNKYIKASFFAQHTADIPRLNYLSADLINDLNGFLSEAEIKADIRQVDFPKIILKYYGAPNASRTATVDRIHELQQRLADKLWNFIRLNNLYGEACRDIPRLIKIKDDPNWDMIFDDTERRLEAVISNSYIIDIFEDGSAESTEMMKALLDSVFVLLRSDALKHTYEYIIDGETGLDKAACSERLTRIYRSQFAELEKIVLSEDFLSDKTEDQLFEIYNIMIENDRRGYMRLNKGKLPTGSAEKKLNDLIGLAPIKESIQKIKAYAIANKDSSELNLHMCFYGNPGTGKTEVARLIAGIFHENGLLPTSKVIETDRSGLVGRYLGETPHKTNKLIEQAMGGVLFIDEAYSLVPDDTGFDYGHEAIAALIKAMEDHRGKFCVILAGYKNKMQEMIGTNPGFRSRIQFELDFPNYSREELNKITALMLSQRGYSISNDANERILDITDIKRKDPNFANAREIRNILDKVIMSQNLRCLGTDSKAIEIADVNSYIRDSGVALPTVGEGGSKKIMTADDELNELVGLASVKRMVKKIKAYGKRNKGSSDFNLHMCFYGNPGTGKTEVARILSSLLYEAGVLPEAKLIETDAHGLIAKYAGQTASKTLDKINSAMGGVLFVDEAYSLIGGSSGNAYGDEAIAVLLKEMEDRRGKLCVILAGYKNEMNEMIRSNPGLSSRIQFTLDFPDYTRDELAEIAEHFLRQKKYTIDDKALELVLDTTEYYRRGDSFANARTLRNILDQVIMNQNLRTEDTGGSEIIISDVEDYISDEGIDLTAARSGRKIGFN